MDWDDSAELAAFRERIRTFFEEKLPERYKLAAGGEWLRQMIPGPDGRADVLRRAELGSRPALP